MGLGPGHFDSHNEGMPNPAPEEPAGGRTAPASFSMPFDMLDACHDRVRSSLGLLARLVDHLRVRGDGLQARDAACDVMRYFDIAAPQHHQDEERHVLPRLEASGDPELAALAQRLRAEHRLIEGQWCVLWPLLEQVASQREVDLAELDGAARCFTQTIDQHMRAEEQVAYPIARLSALCEGPDAVRAMGEEMAGRRGLRLPR